MLVYVGVPDVRTACVCPRLCLHWEPHLNDSIHFKLYICCHIYGKHLQQTFFLFCYTSFCFNFEKFPCLGVLHFYIHNSIHHYFLLWISSMFYIIKRNNLIVRKSILFPFSCNMIFNSDVHAQNEKSLTFVECEGVSQEQSCYNKSFCCSSKSVILNEWSQRSSITSPRNLLEM